MNSTDRPASTIAGFLTREEADAVFSGLALLVLQFDSSGHCVRAKPSPALAPALDPAALVGLGLADMGLPDDGAGEFPADIVNRPAVLRAGGDVHHMYVVQMRPLAGDNGREFHMVLRAETAAEAEQREFFFLPEIARRTGNIVTVTDADRRIVWVNAAYEKRTGYSLQEVIGRRPGELVQFEGTDQETVARISAALKSNRPVQAEIRNRSRQGDEYWMLLDIQPLWGVDGALRGYMGIQSDVSALKTLAEKAETAASRASELANEHLQLQNRLREAIGALPNGLAVFDGDLRLTLSNRKFAEFVRGAATGIAPGATYETIIREIAQTGGFLETAAEQEQWVSDKLARLDRSSYEWQYFNTKCAKWIKAIDRRLPNGGLISLRIDVTALKEASDRLTTVIKGAEVGTWTRYVATGMNEVDDLSAAMLGHRPGELREISDADMIRMIHPDDRETVLSKWARVEQGDAGSVELVFRLPHRDGHWVSFLSRGMVSHRNLSGRPEVISGVNINVTEHRKREDALEQALRQKAAAEQRFYDIANVSDDWLWEQDENLRYTWISDSITRNISIPVKEIIGKTREEVHGDNALICQAPDWEGFKARIAARKPFSNIQYPVVSRSTGKVVWLRASGAPIFDPEGNFRGYRGVGTNVTELVEARERAEEASRTKSLFLANMSHEIRTPLNGVLGMAELLETQITDPEQKRMIGIVRQSGESLLSILNDLLDMSKIEAGRLELEMLPFRPADLAEPVANLYGLKAQEQGLEFEVLTGSGVQQYRLGDQNRVRQILNNLIGNAIKFTETGEVIVKISARSKADLTIEVRDTGIGISPQQQKRLFDDFSQADASIVRRFGGTGLGLAIVKRLVDMMGGQIRVDSALGAGTCITVSLPLAECAAPAGDQCGGEAAPQAHRLEGVRILAADDNNTNRLLLSEMLRKFGAEVTPVANGELAVKAWAPGRFDVVILDISMPVMNGIEALRQIQQQAGKSSANPVPAIALTANVMAHQVSEYTKAGFARHVAKPFRAAELLDAINAILPGRM